MTEKYLGTSDLKYLKTAGDFGIIRSDIIVPNAKFILTNGDRLVFTPIEPHVKDFAVFAVVP
jgi:hypothetical protein